MPYATHRTRLYAQQLATSPTTFCGICGIPLLNLLILAVVRFPPIRATLAGLSGALRWSSSLFCGAWSPGFTPQRFGPCPGGGTGSCPPTRSSRLFGCRQRVVGLSCTSGTPGMLRAVVVPVAGGWMKRMSGLGGQGGLVGRRLGWGERLGRVRGARRFSLCRLLWLPGGAGAGAPLFLRARFRQTAGVGSARAWAWKKGCVACWSGCRSGGSAGVCMVGFARFRVRLASF